MLPDWIGGFGDGLDEIVSFEEEVGQIAAQDEGFGEPAEETERCGEAEFVAHEGCAIGLQIEVVVVDEAFEHAAQHGVLEVVRAIVGGDDGLMRQVQSEVARAEGDGLIRADDAAGDACDGFFAGVRGAGFVQVDAEGQKKAALDWRCDLCYKVDLLHVTGSQVHGTAWGVNNPACATAAHLEGHPQRNRNVGRVVVLASV